MKEITRKCIGSTHIILKIYTTQRRLYKLVLFCSFGELHFTYTLYCQTFYFSTHIITIFRN